jgi:hypothetical protein
MKRQEIKETVIQMKPDFAWAFFEISEMTNIRNLFSQTKQGIFPGKTKKILVKNRGT